jgi:hypothetical protein
LTSHILATDVSQSHCKFNSHMKYSLQRLIPFLPFLRLPIPKTRLDYCRLIFYTPSRFLTVPPYNYSARTPRKIPSSIVKTAWLLIRYLAMDVLYCRLRLCCGECVYRHVAQPWVYMSNYTLIICYYAMYNVPMSYISDILKCTLWSAFCTSVNTGFEFMFPKLDN